MNKSKQKLELTWIGKDDEYKDIEPRILVEVPEKSYGDKNTENMLIHGDNLLALKALEQDYTGKIKCIYIDPPYNTGSAFEHYDDNVEHSKWLSLMKSRLQILKNLLSNDGCIFVQIDDNEQAYLKILMDEIFGRKNFCGIFIWEKKKKPSFLNSNMGVVTEYILSYAKDRMHSSPFVYGLTTSGKKYPLNNAGNGLKILKFPAGKILFRCQDQIFEPQNMSEGNIKTKLLTKLEIKNGKNVNDFMLEGEWRYSQAKLDEIISNNETIVISKAPFRPNHIKQGGEPKKIKNLLSIAYYGMSTNEDATEESRKLFGVQNAFDYPKPEKLIECIINTITEEGDLVLDSFLGSGTTAAVAHKMGRKWIGIELGDHCYTHCEPRLHQVVDGTDQGGISKAVEWKGGGGYKFYELAPSLLKKDEFDNWIIEPKYDAEMLAEAMAKHEGYKFSPDENNVYKQGYSTEKDFIFTTTQFLSNELLNQIHNKLEEGESLLICATHFEEGVGSAYSNITVKKIPQMLLNRCEFGRAEYNLNIIEEAQPEDVEENYEEEV